MSGYVIYHPKRAITTHRNTTIHHDPMRNSNQDPYIWNTRFLHTYCHIRWSCKGSDGIIPCGDAEKQLRRASDAMSTLSGRSSREKWNDSYGQAEMDVQGLSTPVCRTPDPAPNQ